MKIKNKQKFIARISEIIIVIATIFLIPIAINCANNLRGHQAFGGEYLVPILGLSFILIIETIYEENQEKKRRKI